MTKATKPGGGRYDAIATKAREEAGAEAVVLIVLGGKHGAGFTVQERVRGGGGPQVIGPVLVSLLRAMADQIEAGATPDGITAATVDERES